MHHLRKHHATAFFPAPTTTDALGVLQSCDRVVALGVAQRTAFVAAG